jgi:hypothetical protein
MPPLPLGFFFPEAFAFGFFLLFLFGGAFALACLAFWIWMLIDCAQAPEPPGDKNHRLVWILVLIFAGWIGALIYFFVVRRPRLEAQRRPSLPPPLRHPGY